jgi:hypothetical protein
MVGLAAAQAALLVGNHVVQSDTTENPIPGVSRFLKAVLLD